MAQFPFAHTIEITYRLKDGKLETTTAIHNVSRAPMPVMLAYHPFFRPDGNREEWKLSIGARTHWLPSKQLISTGETEPTERFLPGARDLTLGKTFLDDVFSGFGVRTLAQKESRQGRGTSARGAAYLTGRHLKPTARLREARQLAEGRLASAAIDLSDGLAGDVRHICEESKVGCLIDARQLPLSSPLLAHAQAGRRDPIEYALGGGEDYELLFTVPPAKVPHVERLIRRRLLRATPIGSITPARRGLRIIGADGSVRPLAAKGYEHRLG